MLKNLIVLPDGTEIFSGPGTQNTLMRAKFTSRTNDQTELSIGSVCSSMLEATLFIPYGGLNIDAGMEVTAYKVEDDGTRHQVGLYTTEKPTKPSANTCKITAYDRITWLDKDVTQWLASLNAWPYDLLSFAQMVCTECGLVLINEEIPNGQYLVQQFSASGVTGRKLMQWCGEICARFCRATVDGNIEFAWYTPSAAYEIGPSAQAAEQDGVERLRFLGGSLSYEDYQVAPVEKVQIRLTEDDIGAVYPSVEGIANTYTITGNYLLTASTTDALLPVAQTIFEEIKDITYTPCKVSIQATLGINAGDIINITDRNGVTVTAYVMSKTQSGQRDTLECTGSIRRDSSTAVNNESYQALSGKVLEIRKQVEGLYIANQDVDGRLAEISLDVDDISSTVSKQTQDMEQIQKDITQVVQRASDVSITVQSILDNGVDKVITKTGYVFGEDGMVISKSGEEIETRLDHTGMYVSRGDDILLQANKDGVVAADVTIRNYLIVGDHARFEDYGDNRTACFFG